MAANSIEQIAKKVFNLQELNRNIIEELEMQYQEGHSNLIELKSFNGLRVGDVLELAPGVESFFIAQTSNELIFVVVSDQHGNVGSHNHDFTEEIKVIKGKLLEKISNILLEERDVMVVNPFKNHNFISQCFSIYSVKINLSKNN